MRLWPALSTSEILALRGPKAAVDPYRPYAFLVEPERTRDGHVEDVATLFLTNRECPFWCVFCDLWQHTLDESTPVGAIPAQIDWALAQLPAARHIKLYNSGNFFDPLAVPPADYAAIAERVQNFATVIVENHPRLCGSRVWEQRLSGRLEVAMGLETVHPELLPRLNKQMTVADYQRACADLRANDCDVRTFVIQQLPGLSEAEGVEWVLRSLQVAFNAGAGCVSIIPARGGNGAMEQLARDGWFTRPSLTALHDAFRQGLELGRGRVFLDTWGLEQFWSCDHCGPGWKAVLETMNREQRSLPLSPCECRAGQRE